MGLVSATEMLQKAKAGHYAVGQFNINNLEWTKSVLLTAEELKSPVILVKMMEAGINLLPVNIGNMSNRPGTTQYKKSISMTEDEKAAVEKLLQSGIKVTAQMVPDEPDVSIENFF